MAEFLGEPRRQQDEDKSKRATFDNVKAPKPPKHQIRKAEQRADPLRRFARDFQNGLTSLNDAVSKLSKLPKDSSTKSTPTPPVRERVEREVRRTERTVERISKDAPASRSQRVDLPKKIEAPKPQPRQATIRPKTPDDKAAALIKVSKAKDAGRLPFVPRETKERAREAVDSIKKPSNKVPDAPNHASRAAAKPEPLQLPKREEVKPISTTATPERKPVEFLAQTPRATHRQMPIKEPQAKKLEQEIPRFERQGATAERESIVEHGETATTVNDVTVVRREGSKEAAGSELPPNKSNASRSAAFADRRRSSTSLNQPSSAAPTSDSRTPAANAAARTNARGGAASQSSGGGSGNMTLQGELKITGMQDNGEATAELNARVVALESGTDGRNT